MTKWITSASLFAALLVPAVGVAQDDARGADGVIRLPTQVIEGRRQQPVSVFVPVARRVTAEREAPRTTFVKRVVSSVERGPF